eukprot:4538602-Pleurochrysis_carterae.AAC.3
MCDLVVRGCIIWNPRKLSTTRTYIEIRPWSSSSISYYTSDAQLASFRGWNLRDAARRASVRRCGGSQRRGETRAQRDEEAPQVPCSPKPEASLPAPGCK